MMALIYSLTKNWRLALTLGPILDILIIMVLVNFLKGH
jgi:hypothetical protein